MSGKYRWGFAAALPMLFAALAAAKSPLLKEIEDAFVRLGEEVRPSVVEINTEGKPDDTDREAFDELFRFFGNPQEQSPQETPEQTPEPPPAPQQPRLPVRPPQSTGSGFIYDKSGHIITNNHVVANATKITVQLWDGSKHEASVVGQDPDSDIAVIKIDPKGKDLPTIKLGDSDELKVGQFAIAMGSPRGLTGSLSFGHISALGREELALPGEALRFQNFIQTDAGINLGNSGGPLCNIDGEAIGINIAIVFGANSIGFAIPINRVKDVVPQLIAKGRVVRGWLGVRITNIEEQAEQKELELQAYLEAYGLPDKNGVYVHDVTPDGPAQRYGIRPEDFIRTINGRVVKDKHELIDRISAFEPGTDVNLGVWREGKEIELTVKVEEFPDLETAQYGRAYLGLRIAELTPELRAQLNLDAKINGVVVMRVTDNSPAQQAGIRPGSVIIKIAHKDVAGPDQFKSVLKENAHPGKTLLIRVIEPPPSGREDSKFVKVPDDFTMP